MDESLQENQTRRFRAKKTEDAQCKMIPKILEIEIEIPHL